MTDDDLSVLMIPDYRHKNPYQAALVEELIDHQTSVDCIPVRGVLPILEGCRKHGWPDVVHIHWIHVFFDTKRPTIISLLGIRLLFELFVLKLLGTPVVWTVHNTIQHEARAPAVQRRIRHWAARLSSRIIVHCSAATPVIRDSYDLPSKTLEKVHVVPHGNYLDQYPNDTSPRRAREELDVPTDSTVFLYFGLIRPYKNLPALLSAFADLDDPDVRLLVVGNPWTDELKSQVETLAGRDDRIFTELSFIPDESIQLYMNAADVVVLPFESVLTSGSAILGMSFGRALVVPETGCVGELADEDGAVTYDPSEPNAIGTALERTIERRDELPRMGAYNRTEIEQYDWSSSADRTRQIYRSFAS